MSTTTLQSQQQEIMQRIRMHENKARAEQHMAAAAHLELMQINKKIMLAKKSTLKQAQADWAAFCNYMQ